MIERERITGVVLCGGAGARLGGSDKPLLQIGETRIIDLICASLKKQVGTILVSCSRNVAIYESLGYRVVVDREIHRGPLAGIAQAIELVTTDWTLVTPGDLPFLPSDLVSVLSPLAERQGVGVPAIDGVRQNLCLLFNRECLNSLRYFARRGGTAVKHWLDELGVKPTAISNGRQGFLNVNSTEDLAHARKTYLACATSG